MARAPWINDLDSTIIGSAIAKSAIDDVGIHEEPMSSNRGKYIDEYNLLAESPVGSYWCGNFVGYHFKKCGAKTPKFTGRCQDWVQWAQANNLWIATPEIGSAVIYGDSAGKAEHMGIVVCVPPKFSVEGNTSLDGYSRNGDVVSLKSFSKPTRTVLGYVRAESR